jgi:hypothetical protein
VCVWAFINYCGCRHAPQVCATFISHTVAAMVILPIVQSVGEAMPGDPHPKLLVMAAGLTCSAAMGLPVGLEALSVVVQVQGLASSAGFEAPSIIICGKCAT